MVVKVLRGKEVLQRNPKRTTFSRIWLLTSTLAMASRVSSNENPIWQTLVLSTNRVSPTLIFSVAAPTIEASLISKRMCSVLNHLPILSPSKKITTLKFQEPEVLTHRLAPIRQTTEELTCPLASPVTNTTPTNLSSSDTSSTSPSFHIFFRRTLQA